MPSWRSPYEQRPVTICSGLREWEEFCEVTGVSHPHTRVVSMIDHHGVVDTLEDEDEAAQAGVNLELINESVNLLCSLDRKRWHRKKPFTPNAAFRDFVIELDGYVFTDVRESGQPEVSVYRENWMEQNCIGVDGDKGQVAQLFGKPVLLFDDKEDNIDLLRRKSIQPEAPLDGIVVRRGYKAKARVRRNYQIESNPLHWAFWVRNFADRHAFCRAPQASS